MKTLHKGTFAFLLVTTLVIGAGFGCELIVDFDRTKIDAGVVDSGSSDVIPPLDAPADRVAVDSGGDSGIDTGVDTGVDTGQGVDTGVVDTGADTGVDT